MASEKKIIDVLFKELSNVPDRCTGYRNGLKELLADVVYLEYEHSISRIDVVKQISEKVSAAGKYYHEIKTNSENEGDDL